MQLNDASIHNSPGSRLHETDGSPVKPESQKQFGAWFCTTHTTNKFQGNEKNFSSNFKQKNMLLKFIKTTTYLHSNHIHRGKDLCIYY